jgi:hypothetical protein
MGGRSLVRLVRECGEVVSAEKHSGCILKRFLVERAIYGRSIQADSRVADRIQAKMVMIDFPRGRIAGVEMIRGSFSRHDANIWQEKGVRRIAEPIRIDGGIRIEMSRLAQRMNSCIGPTRTSQGDRAAQNRLESSLDNGLYRKPIGLHLPSAVVSSVV